MPDRLLDFNLGNTAVIQCSGEHGRVIGIALYEHSEPQLMLRYKASDGRAVESWWTQSALEHANTTATG